MSHELTQRKDGFVEMAYCGDAPWHKLGQELVKGRYDAFDKDDNFLGSIYAATVGQAWARGYLVYGERLASLWESSISGID